MKTFYSLLVALGLVFVMNTAQAGRVYVSGGITFSHGPVSIGVYSGPRYGYYGYRYYPRYYYYPRYHRYYPRYYNKRYYYRPHHQHHRTHHKHRYRSW